MPAIICTENRMDKDLELIKIDDNKKEEVADKKEDPYEGKVLDVWDERYSPPHYHSEEEAERFLFRKIVWAQKPEPKSWDGYPWRG